MKKSIAAALVLAALPASAQTLQSQLSRCLAIPGVLQRLACYDGVAKGAGIAPMAAPAYVPPAPVYAAPAYTAPAPAYRAPVTAAAAPPPPVSSFGSERLPQTAAAAPRRAEEVFATVTSLSFDPTGRFTVTLDNGQVWRQLAGDQTFLHETRIGAVRISRGALGSYDLTVTGRHASYRVTRLQ